MEGRCQCGKIRFVTPTLQPQEIFICHCTECRAQSAASYGISAMFPRFEIPNPIPGSNIDEHIGFYYRPLDAQPKKFIECIFCRKCGVRLMHRAIGEDIVSVKGGCLTGLNKEMMRKAVHIWVKSAIVDIPDTLPDGTKVEIWNEEPEEG